MAAAGSTALGQKPAFPIPASPPLLAGALPKLAPALGRLAAAQVRTAESALARGDVAGAEAGAAEALRLAPWDGSAVDLSRRVEAAKAQAQREVESRARQARTTQINAALEQAATALQGKRYEAAIAAYDQVLALDAGKIIYFYGFSLLFHGKHFPF